MKNLISDPQYLKNKLLPKLENKIRLEIQPLVDEELKKNKKYNSDEREKLYNEYLNKLLNELECKSLTDFIEFEYYKIIKIFNKHFPYNSIEHFIESHLEKSIINLSIVNEDR